MNLKEQPLLFELFEEIRKDKVFGNPGLEEYNLIFDLARKNYPINDFDELKFVLEAIWLKNHLQRQRFSDLLEKRREVILELIANLNRAKGIVEADAAPSGTKENDPIKPQIQKNPLNTQDKVQQKEKKTGDENKSLDPLPAKPDPELVSSFSMGTGKQQTKYFYVATPQEKNMKILETPFMFTDDYFPVKRRHLQQAWRSLKNKLDAGEAPELDLQRTIRHTANRGFFTDLIYHRKIINELELFILLDKSETMASEMEFGKELCETARLSNVHKKVGPWYFYEVPKKNAGDYVVNSEDYTRSISLRKLLTTKDERNKFILKKNVVVLIYSDCGALARATDKERVTETTAFINYLHQCTSYIAWLNPAPRSRWPWTNAEKISKLVPMFETTRGDLENAISALKGRIQT